MRAPESVSAEQPPAGVRAGFCEVRRQVLGEAVVEEMTRDLFAVYGLLAMLVSIGRFFLFRNRRSVTMAARK